MTNELYHLVLSCLFFFHSSHFFLTNAFTEYLEGQFQSFGTLMSSFRISV